MKKYYIWSILVNFIPIIITYILLSDCYSDGCLGKFLIWLNLPFSALLFLPYFSLKKISNSKLQITDYIIIYFPSIVIIILSSISTILNDEDLINTLKLLALIALPSFIYNIFVNFRLEKKSIKNGRKVLLTLSKPIAIILIFYLVFNTIYTPKHHIYKYDIGEIELNSIEPIKYYLKDTNRTEYRIPSNFNTYKLGYWWPNSVKSYDDFVLFFDDENKEIIQIELIKSGKTNKVKIHAIWTFHDKTWKRKFKKNDSDAEQALKRIENILITLYEPSELKIMNKTL